MNSTNSPSQWHPRALLVCHFLALLLAASWYSDEGREFWFTLDSWIYFNLNGTLHEGYYWQNLWALLNTRGFDVVVGLSILTSYAIYVFSGNHVQRVYRVAFGVLIVLVWHITITLSIELLESNRASPSLTLQPTILLSELITNFPFKDSSGSSFPGDHAITLVVLSTMIWFLAGHKVGLIMTIISIALLLPRMVVGAHWFTDNLIGGTLLSLICLSWVLATPIHIKVIKLVSPVIDVIFTHLENTLQKFR